MSNLQYRQSIIQNKRKVTSWREFVMEICSWSPVVYTKDRGLISKYPKSSRISNVIKVVDFDIEDFGYLDFVPGDVFISRLVALFSSVSHPNMRHANAENSEYSDVVVNSRNAYLSNTVITGCESILYSVSIKDHSHNVLNSMMVRKNCANIFNSKVIINSFNIFYSQNIHNCSNVWLSHNLLGCSECLLCDNLENKSYCIANITYSKEEYHIRKKEVLRNKESFGKIYNQLSSISSGNNLICDNVRGNSNIECVNIVDGYFCYNVHNGKNLFLHGSAQGSEYAYDCYTGGSPYAKHFYGVNAGGNSEHLYCCRTNDQGCNNLYYCCFCSSCSFCLGCIGLKNKSYCILNKQYTKEERYIEVDKIFGQMETDGILGQFFPATMNPFYFNDTAAYLIDPTFIKEEVTAKGYLWRDEPIKVDIPAGVQTVKVSELGQYEGWSVGTQFFASDHIFASDHNNTSYRFADGKNSIPTYAKRTINDEILKKVILDDAGNAYRIIPMELEFLRKYELPLPRKHWLDRMKENFRIN